MVCPQPASPRKLACPITVVSGRMPRQHRREGRGVRRRCAEHAAAVLQRPAAAPRREPPRASPAECLRQSRAPQRLSGKAAPHGERNSPAGRPRRGLCRAAWKTNGWPTARSAPGVRLRAKKKKGMSVAAPRRCQRVLPAGRLAGATTLSRAAWKRNRGDCSTVRPSERAPSTGHSPVQPRFALSSCR